MRIDPSDWRQPGVDAIVDETLHQVDTEDGNVILLHDGGGDRSQTVTALPRIIERLKENGYRFATVSDLLGQTRDTIMPEVKGENPLVALGNRIGFFLLYAWSACLQYLFVLGTILGLGRLGFLAVMSELFTYAVGLVADRLAQGWQLPDMADLRAENVEHLSDVFPVEIVDPTRIVAHEAELASFPDTYLKLRQEIESPSASVKSLSALVSQDISLSAKLLKLVNSPMSLPSRYLP